MNSPIKSLRFHKLQDHQFRILTHSYFQGFRDQFVIIEGSFETTPALIFATIGCLRSR